MKTTHFEPGNRTRYTLSHTVDGNYDAFIWWKDGGGGGTAMRILKSDYSVAPNYVAEKLGANEEDGKCLAYFIATLRGGPIFSENLPRCISVKDAEKHTGKPVEK